MSGFDPAVLARLKNLSLRARTVVDGIMTGIHPSRAKGTSSEFEGHREYAPGDDLRHIDWKAYGKFDRYYLKEYRQTTNLKAHLLVDASASMGYGSNGVSKFEYGITLAASLAYLMLRQQDAVGLITFAEDVKRRIPARATQGHLVGLIRELEERKPSGETRTGPILQELAGTLKRKGVVVLVSDLLDDPEEVIRGLKQIRSRGSEVLVFQLLDREELEFPFEEPTLFVDLEEDLRIQTDPRPLRPAYLKALNGLIDRYREACAENRIDYNLYPTTAGLDLSLARYLTWREKIRTPA